LLPPKTWDVEDAVPYETQSEVYPSVAWRVENCTTRRAGGLLPPQADTSVRLYSHEEGSGDPGAPRADVGIGPYE